nr:hypothetical protein [Prevotella intermedia]
MTGRHRFVPSHYQGGGRSNSRRSQDKGRKTYQAGERAVYQEHDNA